MIHPEVSPKKKLWENQITHLVGSPLHEAISFQTGKKQTNER